MDLRKLRWPLLLVLAAVSGCATYPTMVVDGHEVDVNLYGSNRDALIERASFDMGCPKEQLETTLLETRLWHGDSRRHPRPYPMQMGVEGCGHRRVYVTSRSGWVVDSSE